jgi:hypothetical protein
MGLTCFHYKCALSACPCSAAANNPALAGCIPKAMKNRYFNLVAYTDANYMGEELYPLDTLVKNKGPLIGTRITGVCA